MSDASIFERIYEVHQLPGSLRMRNREWSLYFSLDGARTAGELRALFNLTEAQGKEAFQELLETNLIREKPASLTEFAGAVARKADLTDPTPNSLNTFLNGRSPEVNAPPQLQLLKPAQPPERKPRTVAPTPKPAPAPAEVEGNHANVKSFTPLQAPSFPPRKPMSLQAVIQFILKQSPDKNAGQLAVYRVFMGVDTRLLKKSGIQSLRFQEDRLIHDAELQKAISQSIGKSLRVPLPPDLFLVA